MRRESNNYSNYSNLFSQKPSAMANIKGSLMYPDIQGIVWFYQTQYGVLIVSDIIGLPKQREDCKSPIFAYHIHNGNSCTGTPQDPFVNADMHYNPNNCPHPYHAGDLPPLFGANGIAFSVVLTDRFNVDEVVGKTIVIHSHLDDFTTQPSGNAGTKIACGVITNF